MTNFTFSSWLNAWTLREALRRVGEELKVVDSAARLLPGTASTPQSGDRLFFTDERSLKRWLGSAEFAMHPVATTLPIDDKIAFAERCRAVGLTPVPGHRADQKSAPFGGGPWVVKPSASWRGEEPNARGVVCQTWRDVEQAINAREFEGVQRADILVQPWIAESGTQAVSVCGYHDSATPERNLYVMVRRLVTAGADTGCAAAVEVVPLPESLRAACRALLEDAAYDGPFELEFLLTQDGEALALECNPRFWMQHGLFCDIADNYLVRAYLDEGARPPLRVPDRDVVWIDTVYWAAHLKRHPLRTGRELRALVSGKRVSAWPSKRTALKWLWRDRRSRRGRQ